MLGNLPAKSSRIPLRWFGSLAAVVVVLLVGWGGYRWWAGGPVASPIGSVPAQRAVLAAEPEVQVGVPAPSGEAGTSPAADALLSQMVPRIASSSLDAAGNEGARSVPGSTSGEVVEAAEGVDALARLRQLEKNLLARRKAAAEGGGVSAKPEGVGASQAGGAVPGRGAARVVPLVSEPLHDFHADDTPLYEEPVATHPGEGEEPVVPGHVSPPLVPGHVSPPLVPGHVSPPLVPGHVSPPVVEQGRVRYTLAVIIDDLGYNSTISKAILDLPADLTLAILPGGGYSRELARAGHAAGREILLHQPMEPQSYPRSHPGPGAVFVNMSTAKIQQIVQDNLGLFPEAVGLNNHMGSRFTEDRRGMDAVLDVLLDKQLFFVDSRTSTVSIGAAQARARQVPVAARDVFLDNTLSVGVILRRLADLERQAIRVGEAVGIGHPHRETWLALQQWLPTLSQRGIRLVRVSRFLRPVAARQLYPDRHAPVEEGRLRREGVPAARPADVARRRESVVGEEGGAALGGHRVPEEVGSALPDNNGAVRAGSYEILGGGVGSRETGSGGQAPPLAVSGE